MKLDSFTDQEKYQIACELSRYNIFGPWEPDGTKRMVRAEPGRMKADSRVKVWYAEEDDAYGDKSYCNRKGWYWELGFGVAGISRVANHRTPQTRTEAMQAVDEILRQCPDTIIVGT